MTETSPENDDSLYLDDFDEEKPCINKLLISLFIGFFAIGGVCLLGWVFLQSPPLTLEETPIIKADNFPVKIKPEDPGGMVVANMDKTVYDNFSGNADSLQKTAKILPAPEEPVDRVLIVTDNESVEVDNNQESPRLMAGYAVTEVVTPPQDNVIALHEAVKEGSGDAIRPLTESDLKLIPDQVVNKKAKEKEESKIVQSEGYKIQLAAFKSEKDAAVAWEKIQKSHMDILGTLQYHIERKEVGKKGVFYRLQAGMIAKESEARLLCKKLSEVKQGCFVVH